MADERAIGLLARELSSSNEWVRLAAATALDEMGRKAELQSALSDKNEYVRRVAEHGTKGS